jgi:acyl-coenzyme A synthetase/AMP-(fatty) acid ligase
MIFANKIIKYPPSTLLLQTDEGHLSISDIKKLLTENTTRVNNLYGRRVLLATSNLMNAIGVMALLDGVVDALGFASPGFTLEVLFSLALEGRFDAVLTDVVSSPEKKGEVIFCSDIDSLFRAFEVEDKTKMVSQSKWMMTTSGTTGTPKIVSHTLDSLSRTTKFTATSAQHVRWGMLYDFTRFAGMQVLLQSLLSGSILLSCDSRNTLEEKLAFFRTKGVTHISATPTLWRQILMTPNSERLPLACATLGGEIADQRTLDRLAHTYPNAQIIHIFASTETGVGFSVKDKKAGFPLKYLEDIPNGVSLRIREGILEVFNREVENQYVGTDQAISVYEGWIPTGDLVKIEGDRILFNGRASGTINVGGNKVQPEIVEMRIMSHNSIAAARVYSKSSPITGSLVMADIILTDSTRNEKEVVRELKQFLLHQLEPYQVPAVFRVVESFSVNTAGKVDRK